MSPTALQVTGTQFVCKGRSKFRHAPAASWATHGAAFRSAPDVPRFQLPGISRHRQAGKSDGGWHRRQL